MKWRPDAIDVVVSTQHRPDARQSTIQEYVRERLLPQALDGWSNPGIKLFVNPTGEFSRGGPEADCGVTDFNAP